MGDFSKPFVLAGTGIIDDCFLLLVCMFEVLLTHGENQWQNLVLARLFFANGVFICFLLHSSEGLSKISSAFS